MHLQQQRAGQQARRHARPPVRQAIQLGKVIVAEELIALPGEEAVEAVAADVVEPEVVTLEEAPLVAATGEHDDLQDVFDGG